LVNILIILFSLSIFLIYNLIHINLTSEETYLQRLNLLY
jgi:hypothetical protein